MIAKVAIAGPQNAHRDCYAAAPNLDLTLRSNGEETVQVMDSFGNFVQAGFDPPAVAPTLALGAGGGGLTDATFVGYVYVYVAKLNYPLVDAGTSGGGSIAPRSNPSPSATINITGGAHHVTVTLPTSTRLDISHIWIYRTLYFTTLQEATDAINAGTAFWIGEIANNSTVTTINFDDGLTIAAGEEVDTDCFTAPQFQFCAYFDPYFWGFGNFAMVANCTIAADGSFAFTDSTQRFFSGRNGQTISFAGITTGGYDGHGNYYLLVTNTNGSGRCMLDQALTSFGTLPSTGTTVATIKGQQNILYRSKPHDPFAWGDTTLIGDIRVPALYAFRIGGGVGTAIAIIPNLNLLKLDTEAPGISYVLNLRLAGTPAFEDSKRELSRGFSVTNHFSQFSTLNENGNTVLWGYDFKSSSVLQCDGSTQIPISSKVFDTLRSLQLFEFNHGIYDDHTELAIFWFSTGLYGEQNDLAILYHVPTGNWSLHIDHDVSCSDTIFDSLTGENKTIVGTSKGLIGQALAEDVVRDWTQNLQSTFNIISTNPGADATFQNINGPFIGIGTGLPNSNPTILQILGVYIQIYPLQKPGSFYTTLYPTIAKIVAVPASDTIDVKFIVGGPSVPLDPLATVVGIYFGAHPTFISKFTQLSSPTTQKQLTEIFLNAEGIGSLNTDFASGQLFGVEFRLSPNLDDDFSADRYFGTIALAYMQRLVPTGGAAWDIFYNKNLNTSINFSSILGFHLEFSPGNISLKDYSLIFENS